MRKLSVKGENIFNIVRNSISYKMNRNHYNKMKKQRKRKQGFIVLKYLNTRFFENEKPFLKFFFKKFLTF